MRPRRTVCPTLRGRPRTRDGGNPRFHAVSTRELPTLNGDTTLGEWASRWEAYVTRIGPRSPRRPRGVRGVSVPRCDASGARAR
jgi:hypothetical protein